MLPEPFTKELAEADALLAKAQGRLASLKDFAEYEGLPSEVTRRLENKGRVILRTREDLNGIPELVEQAGTRR